MRTRQRNLTQSLCELAITDYSVSGHLPSHLACLAVPCCGNGDGHEHGCLDGSDGHPTPRGLVGFVFLQTLLCHFTYQHVKAHSNLNGSHLVSGPASGPEKLSPCRLVGKRGKTIRRGIHESTSVRQNGLCAVVPVSHEYLGATASDVGSVGESVQ